MEATPATFPDPDRRNEPHVLRKLSMVPRLQQKNKTRSSCNMVPISSGNHRPRMIEKRNRLVEENLALVPPIAVRIKDRLPPCFELDDLIQTGNCALLKAATGYRPEAHDGAPFAAYARKIIFGAIMNSVSRRNYAEATMVSISFNAVFVSQNLYSEDWVPRSYSDGSIVEVPSRRAEVIDMEERIDRSRKLQRVNSAAEGALTPFESKVMDAYYSPAMPSLAAVAEQLATQFWRVQRAHDEALEKLRRELKAA